MKGRIFEILCISLVAALGAVSLSGCSTGAVGGGRGTDGSGATEGLAVIGIQLHIDESIYSSTASFEAAMRRELEDVCGGPNRPDLVVFPEYTSVFLAAADYTRHIGSADTFAGALEGIREEDGSIGSLRALFLGEAEQTEKRLDRVWGTLAREFGVSLVGGTYFRKAVGPTGEPALRNTLVLYDSEGRRIYEQDKVYLTDFEKTVLGLSPGTEGEAATVRIDRFDVAFTICRDSFFSSWEDDFAGAEVWISIKANGVTFDQEARRTFREALPERIAESEVPYGIVVCLTGRFLDLFWEGESSVFVDAGETVQVLEKSRTPWFGDAVELTLPPEGVP